MLNNILRDEHACDAIVCGCIDYRIWRELIRYVDQELKLEKYDISCEAGSVKSILEETEGSSSMKGISIACRSHSVRTIVLSAHEDCSAYGGSKKFVSKTVEREFHIKQLQQAKDSIVNTLLDDLSLSETEKNKTYIVLYAHFSEDGTKVEIERIIC